MKKILSTTIIFATLGFASNSFAWWGNNSNPMDTFFGSNNGPMGSFWGNNNRHRYYGNYYQQNSAYGNNYRQNHKNRYRNKGNMAGDTDIDIDMDMDMKFRMKMDNDFWADGDYRGQGNGRHNYQSRNNWKTNSKHHQYNIYAPYPINGPVNNAQYLKQKKSYEYYVNKMKKQQAQKK